MTQFHRFRRLRSKMTLTYTAVTGGVFFFLWLLLIGVILSVEGLPAGSAATAPVLGIVREDIAAFLQQIPPDEAGLRAYLDLRVTGDTLRIENDSGSFQAFYDNLQYVAVTNVDGTVLAVEPQLFPADQTTLPLPDSVHLAYEAILNGEIDFRSLDAEFSGEEALYTLQGLPNRLGGMVIVFRPQSMDESFRSELFWVASAISVILLCGTLLMGTLFGWLASRGLVKRLGRLETAASAWAKGEFDQTIADASRDEIGQLGRHLNLMAEKLRDLISTQTALAGVEERNRLARDLHDTVKQQIFAASMQISAARALLARDPLAADKVLAEVESLTETVQEELAGLIQALRPAALQEQGLEKAVRQYAADWSRRTKIEVNVVAQNERPLPIEIEQSFYRVMQEGLANVAKHAQASQVNIQLRYQPQTVTLRIQDNGTGFIPEQVVTGVGLASMKERLALLNGLMTVESQLGRGTVISAIVEVQNE